MDEKKLRHVVMFRFASDVTEAQKARVTDEFAALRHKVPGITAFECGVNNSPEGLSQGFTHCYMLTFESEAARDVYLPHPAHKAFGETLNGLMDGVFVADWWTTP